MTDFLKKYKQYEAEGNTAYIPADQLEPYCLYKIHARNARFGIWVPEKNGFVIRRFKFGDVFAFVEIHYDLNEHFGTAKPLAKLEETGFIKEDFDFENGGKYNEILNYLEIKMEQYDKETTNE